jgi:pilus assembly protein Flp/PilA
VTTYILDIVQDAISLAKPLMADASPSCRLLSDESGQDMIEYALIAAIMGLGTVTGLHGLASAVAGYFNTVLNAFNAALSGQV